MRHLPGNIEKSNGMRQLQKQLLQNMYRKVAEELPISMSGNSESQAMFTYPTRVHLHSQSYMLEL